MTTLIPKNWSDHQHYKDRQPPWIKLHHKILSDRKFMCLQLASKALAPLLWLLASESKTGEFDGDPEELAFRLHMTVEEVNAGLIPLMNAGFFYSASKNEESASKNEESASENEESASDALACRKRVASISLCKQTETETETEVNTTEHTPPVSGSEPRANNLRGDFREPETEIPKKSAAGRESPPCEADVAVEIRGSPHDDALPMPSPAGAVCVAIRAEKIAGCNPQDPRLLALLAAGAEIGEFVDAARICRQKKKPFAYLLSIVQNRRADAAAIAANARASPASRRKTRGEERREVYEKLTGRTAKNAGERDITGECQQVA